MMLLLVKGAEEKLLNADCYIDAFADADCGGE